MATALSPPVICSVVEERAGDALTVRGRIETRAPTIGGYRLRVLKSSPSGTTALNQNGEFRAGGAAETLVGSATFNLEPGVAYRVELSVTIGSETFACDPLDRKAP